MFPMDGFLFNLSIGIRRKRVKGKSRGRFKDVLSHYFGLGTSPVFSNAMLPAIPCGKHPHPHFINERTEFGKIRSHQGHPAGE